MIQSTVLSRQKLEIFFLLLFNNNNNNNNNKKLQLGYHPVAVVILHVHKYEKKVTRKFKSGGLHERHVRVVTTWYVGNHLSIRL